MIAARFENKQKYLQFLEILNNLDPFTQYTTETENDLTQFNFLEQLLLIAELITMILKSSEN